MDQPDDSPNILVAPLDWGLGHATRCIPLIQELLRCQCKVTIAACGRGKALLQQEFPQLPVLSLQGYEIQYAATAWGLALKIVAQIPKLFAAIQREKAWLEKLVAEQAFDAVISDNRYGLHHPQLRSVFITHQLGIKAPVAWVEGLLRRTAYRYINRFDECWVPDAEGPDNLAGDLSHPGKLPQVAVRYTGSLSRFRRQNAKKQEGALLLLLSGPEPQRSLLEACLLKDLKEYTKPVVLVRGLPGTHERLNAGPNVSVYNHLTAAALEKKLAEASLVVSRCGYSTVMDLAALQKRSILIPTPGQTEQEYLAQHLMKQNLALCVAQKKFRLKTALSLAVTFPYRDWKLGPDSVLAETVQRLVLLLKNKKTKP